MGKWARWSGATAGAIVISIFISEWAHSTVLSPIGVRRAAEHPSATESGQSVPPSCITAPVKQAMPPRADPGIAEAQIQRLISDSGKDREEAKRNLISMGEKAKEPLVSALWDLITDRHPRFSPANEKKGEEAVKRYMVLAAHGEGKYPSRADKAWDRFARLEVNHILGRDIIDLLVELKAEEAVCPLVAMLWGTEYRDSQHALEISALRELGSVAVPHLITEMRAAPGAISQARTDLGFDPESYSPGRVGDEQPQWRHLPAMPAEDASVVQWHIVRIVWQIRDPSAIPALRELASTTADAILAKTAADAATALESRQ